MKIHETAIVSPDADIASDVEVGAYSIIENGVRIGSGCKVHSHVHILGQTTIDANCTIWPGVIIGGDPQSVGFDSALPSGVDIGPNNTIRENVTIHRSLYENKSTVLGEGNFLMAGSHLGHDCELGNNNILANAVALGGHVVMGNRCFIGGNSVVHQFVRIGDFVLFQGLTGASQDIPPYLIVYGINQIAGLNVVGMRRGGFDRETRAEIKRVYHIFYREKLSFNNALTVARQQEWGPEAQLFIDFLSEPSKRGYCMRTRQES